MGTCDAPGPPDKDVSNPPTPTPAAPSTGLEDSFRPVRRDSTADGGALSKHEEACTRPMRSEMEEEEDEDEDEVEAL